MTDSIATFFLHHAHPCHVYIYKYICGNNDMKTVNREVLTRGKLLQRSSYQLCMQVLITLAVWLVTFLSFLTRAGGFQP